MVDKLFMNNANYFYYHHLSIIDKLADQATQVTQIKVII